MTTREPGSQREIKESGVCTIGGDAIVVPQTSKLNFLADGKIHQISYFVYSDNFFCE